LSAQHIAIDIRPGEHVEWHGIHVDTLLATVIAGGIVVLLGVLMARRASVTKPKGLQLFFETVTKQVEDTVESSMGIKTAPFVVPLAECLFLFILIANWIGILPAIHHGRTELLAPPAADVNLTYSLALLVIVWMHVTGIRNKGFKGYYHHLVTPSVFMLPINIIEEIVRPVTLALRLFGNIFSGVIMVLLITAMPAFIFWIPELIWKLFDMFIGLIQAFIFGLLTILYFASTKPAEEGAH
jgi:F-type H+-transporting ATPase subunit a